jgi:hypothetical protein
VKVFTKSLGRWDSERTRELDLGMDTKKDNFRDFKHNPGVIMGK